jgi:hypothetical protein
MPFVGNPRQNMPKGIAYYLKDYHELLDLTGRCVREDKAGYINSSQHSILERLGLAPEQMMQACKTHTKDKRLWVIGTVRAPPKRA